MPSAAPLSTKDLTILHASGKRKQIVWHEGSRVAVGILVPCMLPDLPPSGLQNKGLAAVPCRTETQAAQQLGGAQGLWTCELTEGLPPSAGACQPPLLPGKSAAAADGPAAAACRDSLCAPPAGWQPGGSSVRSPPAVRQITAGPGAGWQPATWRPLSLQNNLFMHVPHNRTHHGL